MRAVLQPGRELGAGGSGRKGTKRLSECSPQELWEQRSRGPEAPGGRACLTQAVATAKEPLKCARGLNASVKPPALLKAPISI